MYKSVYEIRNELVSNISILEEYTKNLGAELISANLKQMRMQYTNGLVRIIFMGGTNSGKSTTINALLKKVVVPENPNTASPVPVWIGYTPRNEKIDVVFRKDGSNNDVEVKNYSALEFRKEFCYNHMEQSDTDRKRFENVKWASVMTNSEILKNGITLIDSLGTKANDVDSVKTIEILNEGVDAVFYLINPNNGLQKDDVEFIREKLFGYGRRSESKHVSPKNFVLVINRFNDTPIGIVLQGLNDKLKELFKKENGEFDLEGYNTVRDNIVVVNSRRSRLASCGAFPYVDNAPHGSDERYMRNAKELEDLESLKASQIGEEDVKEANIEGLRLKIKSIADELCYGQNSIVNKRLNELIELCNLIERVAEKRLDRSDEKLIQIKKIMIKVAEIRNFFDDERERMELDLQGFETNLIDSINTILNISDIKIYGQYITGLVEEIDQIPHNLPTYAEYKNSLSNGNFACFELIKDVIEPIITQCLSKVGRKIVEDLWDYQFNLKAYKSPKELIEDIRRYLFYQRKIFSRKLEELREENIDNIGIILPDEKDIKRYGDNLVTIAETSVLYSFNTYTDISKWSESCKSHLKSVKPGVFSFVFSGFDSTLSQEKFWQRLKDKVISPTVLSIFNAAFLRGNEYVANDRPIRNSFTVIIRNFSMLFDKTILQIQNEGDKIEKEISASNTEHAKLEKEMQSIIDNTAILKADLKENISDLIQIA